MWSVRSWSTSSLLVFQQRCKARRNGSEQQARSNSKAQAGCLRQRQRLHVGSVQLTSAAASRHFIWSAQVFAHRKRINEVIVRTTALQAMLCKIDAEWQDTVVFPMSHPGNQSSVVCYIFKEHSTSPEPGRADGAEAPHSTTYALQSNRLSL